MRRKRQPVIHWYGCTRSYLPAGLCYRPAYIKDPQLLSRHLSLVLLLSQPERFLQAGAGYQLKIFSRSEHSDAATQLYFVAFVAPLRTLREKTFVSFVPLWENFKP